jgi:8-oxo-dGTP diphosphatase
MENQCVKVGVGVVVLDGRMVLLIQRGHPPKMGQWSLPGGHLELGETLRNGAQREVEEETGLNVIIQELVDVVDLIDVNADGSIHHHYSLIDYWAEVAGGVLKAASDAADAKWFDIADIASLGLWGETERIIHKAAQMRDKGKAT